ncbi:MAG: copper amine oxidase N-terminal domain-containing protein [Candidatus Eremiobacteraeota bacterium]|nr:copper amine oxidase N-terminal domain-containing protein [Candidatus Eremiobacteraeota bacterium]
MRAIVAITASLIVTAATPHAPAASHSIAIVINGETLPLDPPPRFERNLLFVPVRRTIEALGLPFERAGKRITTQIGSKTVTLTIGSAVAQIDRQRISLEAPPLDLHDVLYVPLRFFTDVLGAQARFDRRSNTVTIIAQIVGTSSSGLIATGQGFERFGTVAAVDVLSDPPTLTLAANGIVKTVPVAPNATIDVQDVNVNVTSPGELSDVRPGDFARVEMRKDGRVTRVVDEYGSRNGHIVAIAGSLFVLEDGQVIAPAPTTEISLNGGAASLDELRPNDQVTVRYNVETSEVREILASRGVAAASGPGTVQISDVESDATHPLRAGDTIHVTLRGTSGASASFDIGSDVVDQAMQQRSPGVYVGDYTIPRGANFSDVALIGRLTLGNAVAQEPAPQIVSASSVAPGIADFAPGEGSTINTNRPAVYASFASDAVPVNPASALLWIDGRDVTSECVRTSQFIQYLPSYSYPDGLVHVTVRVADQAGNTTTKSWTFTIRTHA